MRIFLIYILLSETMRPVLDGEAVLTPDHQVFARPVAWQATLPLAL